MAALAAAPQPDQPGRTPTAMFSLLQPGTHIPPHTGVSNARLVVHLPLVVPPGCRFRVGNDIREWMPGEAWVFDDTVEHEAWNDGSEARAILMFDIWHPQLSLAERGALTAMATGIAAFSQEEGGFSL
jgi:aspartate beta-hydroxylase